MGNLQWIAGLNAGFSSQSFEGSVLWREEIPAGEAVPYSLIEGFGQRSVKSWSGIRGSIGNGFCTNRQFNLKVEPTAENDGPWRYSDEDWIPHAGGWASALAHLRMTMRYMSLRQVVLGGFAMISRADTFFRNARSDLLNLIVDKIGWI